MPVTPLSIESLPLLHLRNALSNVAAFRTWTGALSILEAFDDFIEYGSWDNVALDKSTFALIDYGGDEGFEQHAIATGGLFMPNGSLMLYFQSETAYSLVDERPDANIDFMNNVGLVLEGIMALSDSPGFLKVNGISRVYGPIGNNENEVDEDGDSVTQYLEVAYKIDWGI